MPVEIPVPNKIVEEHLDELVAALEAILDADVLAFASPIVYGVDDAIREALEGIQEKRPGLAVILETTGGYIEVVARIADTLRHHYQRVEFVIPNYAMSAGTVLAMSGDAIHMDYYSVLGPIDPQVEREQPDGSRRPVPALGYLIKYDELIKKSEKSALTTAELAFLLEAFDPGELYEFEQARDLTVSLLQEWLVAYKFKDWITTATHNITVTDDMRKERASEIAGRLSNPREWHSHGRGISMTVLRDKINLKIDDFGANAKLNEALRRYYRALSEYSLVRNLRGVLHTRGNYFPLLGG